MGLDRYEKVNGKNLRCGYTTGTCACASAKAAAYMLLSGDQCHEISVETPAGIVVRMDIHNIEISSGYVICSVIKDGGDDPDVTTGMHIYAKVEKTKTNQEVQIEGGQGIGIVTKPGLDQPVGSPAINSTPRKCITEHLFAVMKSFGYKGGLRVTIFAPDGEHVAKKTFNPRMGIEGGISIIGTNGIVRPMSNDAIIQTTRLSMKQRRAAGARELYLTPGRIGEAFAKEIFGISPDECVMCSNNIGEAFFDALEEGFETIHLIGHIGKLVKLGYGAKNTHSAENDGRIEQLIYVALCAGADRNVLEKIAGCVTTDGAVAILYEHGLLNASMEILGERIMSTLFRWTEYRVNLSLCVFTGIHKEAQILIQKQYQKM